MVETTLTDSESGEKVRNVSSGFAMDKNGDKALFKAITGARKYGLSMMFKAHWDSVEPEQDTPAPTASKKRSPLQRVVEKKEDSLDAFDF